VSLAGPSLPSGMPTEASSVPPAGGSTRGASGAAGAKTAYAPGAAIGETSCARGVVGSVGRRGDEVRATRNSAAGAMVVLCRGNEVRGMAFARACHTVGNSGVRLGRDAWHHSACAMLVTPVALGDTSVGSGVHAPWPSWAQGKGSGLEAGNAY
jgi:hypothetical protein